MFDPSPKPRVYGLPPGADFPFALVKGLISSFQGRDPADIARVQLIVNTRRMQRRVRTLFDAGPAMLLPRVMLVTDLGDHADLAHIPPAVPPLRRRLEVAQLVANLLKRDPDLAPRAAVYDLADSLSALMDEMQGEGVSPDVLMRLDVSNHSKHWERSLEFLRIVQHFFDASGIEADKETRQRRVIEGLAKTWAKSPPQHPVIVAGSTGSRGATMLLMKAVAKLPQGAIILPGFDFDMPAQRWDDLADALTAEDHPQFRFHKLMQELGLTRADLREWTIDSVPNPARNRLVSLAMRPAPVTDQWMEEGPNLRDIPAATADITLVESPSQRDEALAIALRLRKAAEEGTTAALITPDRMLTRQVTAALDRWNILPDDSAGIPLQLTAPGRFLRHVSTLFHQKLTAESLLTLLSHPLAHSGADRGDHLRLTRELELYIRRNGPPFPTAHSMQAWANKQKDPKAAPWSEWVIATLIDQQIDGPLPLTKLVEMHIERAERIAGGQTQGSGALWEDKPGREATKIVADLQRESGAGGDMNAHDYDALFGAILSRGEVHEMQEPHPDILIWGTLEARVQGADLLILGGLNEGTWPEMPTPDPWMNRQMRLESGLLLPERRIGLSAHDFQQAIGAKEVWLTRSIRSDDAETVASRWVNRLTNLLDGLPDQGGRTALSGMRQRGANWLALARELETPGITPPARRPSPRPPAASRPQRLSVTEIKTLIRDPYAIYARHVLRLNPLDSLMKAPDALLRGNVIHDIMETFVKDVSRDDSLLTEDHLMNVAGTYLDRDVPWPDTSALWRARIARIAPVFLRDEAERQTHATHTATELKTEMQLNDPPLTLVAKADRIDRDADGLLRLYDYKTGSIPSKKEQKLFDKQLLLQTAMLEQGGFSTIKAAHVVRAAFIGLGANTDTVDAPLDELPWEITWARFKDLIRRYQDAGQGFTARRAMQKDSYGSRYDQLSRFGEWDETEPSHPEDLT